MGYHAGVADTESRYGPLPRQPVALAGPSIGSKARRAGQALLKPLVPVILAGGTGSRLWPLSRAGFPKQFHPLLDGRSLFQNALLRAARIADTAPIVVCNESHRFLVAEQLAALGLRPERIVLEPEGRGTAPAIAFAAHCALDANSAANLLVLPADHVVDATGFETAIRTAATTDRALCCFGVRPTGAETGFGYIEVEGPVERSLQDVRSFVEKPDSDAARSLATSGRHFWNSGMYLVDARTAIDEIAEFQPAMARSAAASFAAGRSDGDFFRPGPQFTNCPEGSFDVVVMENTRLGAVLVVDFEWRDIGSWDAYFDAAPADARGNRLAGDVLALHTSNCLIESRSRLVAALGVDRLVVVETADAVLVADRSRAHDVRMLAEALRASGRPEQRLHPTVPTPWGSFERIGSGDRHQVKRLVVAPGASISLQSHRLRSEHWVVVRGRAEVTLGNDTFALDENESAFVPAGVKHRLRNIGNRSLEIVEVQVGEYLGEDDIERFSDDYGRVGGSGP